MCRRPNPRAAEHRPVEAGAAAHRPLTRLGRSRGSGLVTRGAWRRVEPASTPGSLCSCAPSCGSWPAPRGNERARAACKEGFEIASAWRRGAIPREIAPRPAATASPKVHIVALKCATRPRWRVFLVGSGLQKNKFKQAARSVSIAMKGQAGRGSGEMLTRISTESYTGHGENKALTFVFWCTAQRLFLVGLARFKCVTATRRSTPCWCDPFHVVHKMMRATTHLPPAVRTRKARGR